MKTKYGKKIYYYYRTVCKDCWYIKTREWIKNNPDKVSESNRKWAENNPEKRKEWYKNNAEKMRVNNKRWHKNNPEKIREIQRRYRKSNPEKANERGKKWRENNPEKVKETRIKQYLKFSEQRKSYAIGYYYNHREETLIKKAEARRNNPERFKKYDKTIYKNRMSNIGNKLSDRIHTGIWQSLKGNKNGRHWEDLLEYNLSDLIIRLESLFKDSMSWKNYGKWHIDHIKPISSFNFKSYEDKEFKECWALENLQPLWAEENLRKHNKILYE